MHKFKHIRSSFFNRKITYLKGVGEFRASLLDKEIGIKTYRDLILYFPRTYEDRSKIYSINEAKTLTTNVQIKGQFTNIEVIHGKKKRLQASFTDGRSTIRMNWFSKVDLMKDMIRKNTTYVAFGKLSSFKGFYSMNHPELKEIKNFKTSSNLQPVYSVTEKLTKAKIDSRAISKLMKTLLEQVYEYNVIETLPEWLINKENLISLDKALRKIHFPDSHKDLKDAAYRLKFEESFLDQLRLISRRIKNHVSSNGHVFEKVGSYFYEFYENNLPFKLTDAQKRVVKEIRNDMRSGHQMNRLIQGDVGSGKTMVALLNMLIAIDNGYQTCIMAPTEVLARQHYNSIKNYLQNMDINVQFLSGYVKGKERKQILEDVSSGNNKILIGTHALIQEKVIYKNLGLAIIDEQHRFGVAQRAALWSKNKRKPPHILVMTATPIPRTLALSLYGDLNMSIIDELPPGRKPVKTYHVTDAQRMKVYKLIKSEIEAGRQIYVVYPLIEESEALELVDIENGYEKLRNYFPENKYKISIVHGRMPQESKDIEMKTFASGNSHIMLATTVIEVGVNVPNASVMMIENVERFGLSQLHQLRGRVGRGADHAFCFLMSGDKVSEEGKERIKIMCETNDGFVIARKDLEMRGPGNIKGTQQSGNIDFAILDLNEDKEIIELSNKLCEYILSKDPDLQLPQNKKLNIFMDSIGKYQKEWSDIS